jgi:hypothetical protein
MPSLSPIILRLAMYYNRHNQTGIGDPKPEKVIKIQKKLAKKLKVTGEGEVFKKIANSRKRVSFITGKEIKTVHHYNMAHVLPKKNYPHFRLYERNIVFLTLGEHELWDQGRHKIKDNPAWKKLFILEDELKSEYNQKHPNK